MRRFVPLNALPVAVALFILVASVADPHSSGPTPLGPLGLVGADKYLHGLAYATLAATLALARDRREIRTLALVVLLAAGFGFGIELVQSTLPYRSFDLVDELANTVGACLGVAGWLAWRSTLASRLELRR